MFIYYHINEISSITKKYMITYRII